MCGKSIFAVQLVGQAVGTSTPENTTIPECRGQCLCHTNAPPPLHLATASLEGHP